jgi:class 3 adenylate cyclase
MSDEPTDPMATDDLEIDAAAIPSADVVADGATAEALTHAAAAGDLDDEIAQMQARLDSLPWWRRPRRLRRQLSRTLVFVSLLSVVLVGGLNFFAAEKLLDDGTQDQLVGTGKSRARSIERGVSRTLELTSALAADLAVVNALAEFDDTFIDAGSLDDAQQAELDSFYMANVVAPLAETDIVEVTVEAAEPATDAGRYLQYHYIIDNDLPADERILIDDPGDGSDYSAVHAIWHPYLASLVDTLGFDDVMLISATDGDIVYTAKKRIDFGVTLTEGAYQESELATTVLDDLQRVRTGESVFADLQLYIPARGEGVAFVASAIRKDTELLGALVTQVSVDDLNAITTARGQWESVGLSSGESYVVGSDELLRSESRLWIEDPDAYLDKIDSELAARVEVFDSPVLIQPVETEPVTAAFEGDDFEGTSKNYLGTKTLSFATAIDIPGVDWVVVAEVPLNDARSPLYSYALRMLLIVAIIIPLSALLGAWLANRSTRPVRPVVEAASAVAAGDRDPDLPDLGRDEFGDLGRRLRRMAGQLGEQERELEAEYERTRELLMTVLPPRLINRDGAVTQDGEAAELATAISVSIAVSADQEADDVIDDVLSRVSGLIDDAASDHGVDRVRVAADRSLYVAGFDTGADGADIALAFVDDARRRIVGLVEAEAIDVSMHMGLSTGPIGVGVLQRGSVTFGAWGEPVRRALAISALSQGDQTLVDASTVANLTGDGYLLEAADEVVALDGQPMGLYRLGDPVPEEA